MLVRIVDSRCFSWLLLAAPAVYLTQAYGRGEASYGETLHRSGEWSLWLLLATLALSPLARFLPRAGWLRWLRARRRYLGVAVFAYAALHAAVYLQRKAEVARILDEAMEPGLATGWIAFLILLALAATSNDLSIRRLGARSWRRLHQAVHGAAVLTVLHWILTAFDPTLAWAHAAILAALLLLRIVPRAGSVRAE